MPKKIQDCTKAHLISIDLPVHGDSYTVISHESVMDMSATALANAGFTIADEEYRATADGNIAQGIYRLTYNNDPELSMMFAWTNSYNKQVRFKCGVGAYINKTGTVMVCGDMGSWARKHTGTADEETLQTITDQITNAQMYYNQLVSDKNSMKDISMNKRKQAQMLGILFAEYQILTTEQASMIRQQMDKPSHVFEDSNSLWAFYNYVTLALQHSHPKTWMEDQRILHYFISTINNFSAPAPAVVAPVVIAVDPLTAIPNQTNILDQIAEVEAEEVIDRNIAMDEEVQEYEVKEEQEDKVCDETIIYTDPAGNTFETTSIAPCVGHDAETVKDLEEEILATEVENFFEEVAPVSTLEPTPEQYEQYEAEQANLDLAPAVQEPVVNTSEADFDLDFASETDGDEDDDFAFEF
jgi:hypothetical protein